MDISFVIVDDTVKTGDDVEIYYDLEKACKHLNIPHYQCTTLINKRLPRKLV